MYEAYYGFKEKPFSMLPDPGFLFLSKKHQAALTLLEYGLLNHVGFCVISGEPGAGKTTILRALLEKVSDDITVGLITNTHRSFGGLLDWILSAFNLHRPNLSQVEMHQIFMDFLIEEYANKRTVLLIVDEAQNMTADTLEELRMLSNVNSEKDQLMQIVLAGQPALKDMLRRPELMQFAQRIAVDYHLDALGPEETCGYIQHRLRTAGATRDVFTPAACLHIHNYSGGTPRLINLLCETALVYGFADQKEMVDAELVEEMVHERMKDSVVPLVKREISAEDNEELLKDIEKSFPSITAAEDIRQEPQPHSAQHAEETQDKEETDLQSTQTGEMNAAKEHAAEISRGTDVQSTDVDNTVNRPNAAVEADTKKKAIDQYSPSVTSTVTSDFSNTTTEDSNISSKGLARYGVFSAVLGFILISAAITLYFTNQSETQEASNRLMYLKKQQEIEKQQFQAEAEKLKGERDAALAELEEKERLQQEQDKLEADKLAAEKAEIAAKEAEKKRILEQKRLAETRDKQRRDALAEKRKQAEVERRKLERKKQEQQARLDKQKRQEEEEMRRLQREWLENERKALEEAQAARAAKKSDDTKAGEE